MKLPRIDSVIHHPLHVWAITSAAALLAGLSLLVHPGGSGAADAPPTAHAVSALVAAVDNIEIPIWESHSGRLEAVERVEVRSRAAGVVLAVHFVEGALVAQGQLLYTIGPAPYQADLDRNQAQLMAARARADHTARELARALALLDERAIAQREHDERLNAQQDADAALLAARRSDDGAVAPWYTEVRAPVAGGVGRNEVTIGNVITAGAGVTALFHGSTGSPARGWPSSLAGLRIRLPRLRLQAMRVTSCSLMQGSGSVKPSPQKPARSPSAHPLGDVRSTHLSLTPIRRTSVEPLRRSVALNGRHHHQRRRGAGRDIQRRKPNDRGRQTGLNLAAKNKPIVESQLQAKQTPTTGQQQPAAGEEHQGARLEHGRCKCESQLTGRIAGTTAVPSQCVRSNGVS